jgi:sugar/nucleoside kinase (ribokinase family)
MNSKELDLLCIGNAMVDVFVRLDERTCNHHGISRPVQHVEIETLKGILSDNTACPQETPLSAFITSGGGAANVAKIAGLLGAAVSFTGAIGTQKTYAINRACSSGEVNMTCPQEKVAPSENLLEAETDEYGRLFEKDMREAGVKLNLIQKHSPTGICLILRTENNKTRIAASPSAALEFSESDVSEEEIKKALVVVIDGFMLDRPDLVRRALCLADRYGTTAVLDLSSESIAREKAKEIKDYAGRYSLILFMNEAEAGAFYEGLESSEKNEEGERAQDSSKFQHRAFFRAFTERKIASKETPGTKKPIVVVKLGERGAVCFAEGKMYSAGTQAVNPLETSGAGDAFCGAFLTAWVRNRSISECATLGNKAAGLVLGATGTKVEKSTFESLAEQLKKTAVR